MKKYLVTIEEQVSQTFEVMAEDEKTARIIAEDNYKNGEFVLEPGEVIARRMTVENPDDGVDRWIEF